MRSSFISAALATLLVAAPVQGQERLSEGVVSSVGIGAYMVVSLVTAPIWMASGAAMMASDKSSDGNTGKKTAGKAGKLPPLTVEKVDTKADGAVEVALKNPESPEDLAVIQWPARENNPGKTLKVGDVLALTPTEAGAGWLVANAQGETLAFMPTADAVKNQMSEAY
ncbi:hypothetical protein [Stenotrophomonas sp. PS02289]|uniref:hypothetical protein n=1 Tax=Stenotrophomonas sp. PS02289 TaxID=2991422 RepID=UPI00249A9AC7|nr:hypothetical protein [Stenotrophomonas sp. PS02289]